MRLNRLYIKFIFLLQIINYCSAQKVIEIEVDSIYCQDPNCYLFNVSDQRKYSCGFMTLKLAEDRYYHVIDCDYDYELNVAPELSNVLELKKISSLKQFKTWASNLKFESTLIHNEVEFNVRFQSLNDNYSVIQYEEFESKIPKPNMTEIYQIIPIRINRDYYIAGLIEINDDQVEHLIFPDKNKIGLMYYLNSIWYSSSNKIKIDLPTIYREIFRTFKVRNCQSKKILTNAISSDPILEGEYDEIILDYPFVVTKLGNVVKIYDKTLEDITPKNLIEAYKSFGSLQLIIDNEVKWMNSNKIIVDTMPKIERVLDCGNIPCQEKSISIKNGEFIEIINDCDYSIFNKTSETDSFFFKLNRNLESITYLNNKDSKTFSIDCFMDFYCNPTNLYFFRTKEKTQGIFKRVNVKQEIIDKIRTEKSLSHQDKWKLIKPIIDSLKDSYRDDILFEGPFEDIILSGYNQPIIFIKNGKYGIYPISDEAKYRSLKPFIGNLAEVIFENGQHGWVDLKGREIKKKKN